MVLVVKNPPAKPGDIRDAGSTPGSRRSSEGGDDNSFQYSCLQYYKCYNSCLQNPMDRGAWWAIVHRVTRSQTGLKRLSMHAGR